MSEHSPTAADLNDLLKRIDLLAAQLARMEEQLAQLAALLQRYGELTRAIESGVPSSPRTN
jgi:hypothetical protein